MRCGDYHWKWQTVELTWSISCNMLQSSARQRRSTFHYSVWSVSSHMQRDNGAWKTVWEIVSIMGEFHSSADNCSPSSSYDALCTAAIYIQKFFLAECSFLACMKIESFSKQNDIYFFLPTMHKENKFNSFNFRQTDVHSSLTSLWLTST